MRKKRSTNRDHKDDADNVSLISRFSVIQKVPVDVENSQSHSSQGAKESNNAKVNWQQFSHREQARKITNQPEGKNCAYNHPNK